MNLSRGERPDKLGRFFSVAKVEKREGECYKASIKRLGKKKEGRESLNAAVSNIGSKLLWGCGRKKEDAKGRGEQESI